MIANSAFRIVSSTKETKEDALVVKTVKISFDCFTKNIYLKGLCQLESMRSEVMQIPFNCQYSIVFNA